MTFKVDDQGVLRFWGRICIPDDTEMKKMILEESHRSNLIIHLGAILVVRVEARCGTICICVFNLSKVES
jgi:hypothetical protein